MFSIMLLDEKRRDADYALRLAVRIRPCATRRIPRAAAGRRGGARMAAINVPDVSQDPRYIATNPETRSS